MGTSSLQRVATTEVKVVSCLKELCRPDPLQAAQSTVPRSPSQMCVLTEVTDDHSRVDYDAATSPRTFGPLKCTGTLKLSGGLAARLLLRSTSPSTPGPTQSSPVIDSRTSRWPQDVPADSGGKIGRELCSCQLKTLSEHTAQSRTPVLDMLEKYARRVYGRPVTKGSERCDRCGMLRACE